MSVQITNPWRLSRGHVGFRSEIGSHYFGAQLSTNFIPTRQTLFLPITSTSTLAPWRSANRA